MDTLQEVIDEIRENNNKRTIDICNWILDKINEFWWLEDDECFMVTIYARKWKDFMVSKSNVLKTRYNKTEYDEKYLSSTIQNATWTNTKDI